MAEEKSSLGSFIFEDDLIEFEPHDTFKENFFHWFRPYMRNVFSTQTRRKVKNLQLQKKLEKEFNSKNELEEMRDVINAMARNGFKGPKSYFNPNVLFYNFLVENNIKSISDIKNTAIKYFLKNELENYSTQYKKDILVAVKNFLTFIQGKNIIKDNGDSHHFKLDNNLIKSITKEVKPLAYLDPESEFDLFLNTLNNMDWKKSTAARNRAMLKIILITGIRVSELTEIKKEHIKEIKDSYEITVIGKGNKRRKVYIGTDIIKEDIENMLNVSNDYLFVTRSGNKVDDRYLNTIVVDVMEKAGIDKKDKNGPHMLRHSCATWLVVVAGYDIAKLQVYMAHEDIATTKKYVHLNEKVVKDMSGRVTQLIGKR